MQHGAAIDAFLDRACARLRVNPAQADDIRAELRTHMEDAIALHVARGVDPRQAMELAVEALGDVLKLHDALDLVHQGDPWWVMRLKGLGVGMAIGGLLAALLPIGGHLELATRGLGLNAVDGAQAQTLFNALLVGGLIGLFAAAGRGLLIGWTVGSLVWLAEYLVYWTACVGGAIAAPTGDMLNSILLAPLLGGVFGATVGAGSAGMLSLASRLRPEIQ